MRLGLISDLHWMLEPPAAASAWHGGSGDLAAALERMQLALEHFAEQEVDLIALTGDLSHHGEDEALVQTLQACAGAGVPVLAVSGNHDLAGDALRLDRALASAAVENTALPSLAGSTHEHIRVAGVQVGATDGWFGASLRELPDTTPWGADPVLLISHYPLLSLASLLADNGFPYPGDLLDRAELADRLQRRYAPTVVVGGHVHARAAATAGPVLQLTSGAMVEPPYECAVIELERPAQEVLRVRRTSVRLREPGSSREPVFSPEHEEWVFDGAHWLAMSPAASPMPAGR